jgi:phasin family protein
MSHANKKHAPQASAKPAPSAAKSSQSSASAENVVRFGNASMKDFIATSTGEAKRAQEQALAFSRESAENFAKSTDAMSKFMYEVVAMSRDNVETCIECGNLAASMAKDVSSEAFENANKAFSDSVEASREFFACRTFADMFELQSRMARNAIDSFFNQSSKFSDKFFEFSSEALEPINERVSDASEKFSKALAA